MPYMSDEPMLKVERLTKTYAAAAGPLTVLKGVTLSVDAGATLAVVGPSGSGKTTLLGLCAGLDLPTAGSVTLNGFVFQNFQLIPTLTALENVLVPLELSRSVARRAGDWFAEARSLLERVGLGDRLEHYPVQLSGGEQQRVSLARAFVNRPKILFCDEPTGNLDDETAQAMVELVFGLNRERGTTLVLVTHNLDLAGRCSRIVRLRGGAVVGDEAP